MGERFGPEPGHTRNAPRVRARGSDPTALAWWRWVAEAGVAAPSIDRVMW